MRWVDDTLRALQLHTPDGSGQGAYGRAFTLGETLAGMVDEHCARHDGPHGLALLLDHIQGAAQALGRPELGHGLFAGFCWRLEQLLRRPRGAQFP